MSKTVVVCCFALPRKKKARRKGNTITLEVDDMRAVISSSKAIDLEELALNLHVLFVKARIALGNGKTLEQFAKGE